MKLTLKNGDIDNVSNRTLIKINDIRTIEMTGKGKSFYLWIGTNVQMNYGCCFGTKSGQKTLIKFAEEILKRVK